MNRCDQEASASSPRYTLDAGDGSGAISSLRRSLIRITAPFIAEALIAGALIFFPIIPSLIWRYFS